METILEPQGKATSTLNTVSLLVIATVLLGAALSYTKDMVVPLVFALFLSYFLAPWVSFFRRRGCPGGVSVFLTLFFFTGIIASFVLILRGSVFRLIDSFYLYEERLALLTMKASNYLARYEIKIDQAYLMGRLKELPIFSYVQSAAGTALSIFVDFSLVTIFLIFLLVGQREENKKASALGNEIDSKIRSYIVTKVLSNLLMAICVWIIYAIFGLDLALMFATLTFVLCFIPTVGSIIATISPLPIAIIQYTDAWPIWAVVIFPGIIQILIGNVLEPKLLGKGLDLHPITILLSLMFWGLIWGIAGMFLAVPITAVLKIVLDRHPLTRQFSEVLAGRSPL